MLSWLDPKLSFLLEPRVVTVWEVSFPIHYSFIDEYLLILNPEEKQRANRFHFEQDRSAYIITRACLRLLLARYLNQNPASIRFLFNEHDKPEIAGQPLHFNLSHSHEIALIAFSLNEPIGIDIEYMQREVEYIDLAQRFFADEEVAQLLSATTKQAQANIFFNLWTRKEAFVKAIGRGLSFPLKNFAVMGLPNQNPELLRVSDPQYALTQWTLVNLEVGTDYRAALAGQDIKNVGWRQAQRGPT